MAEWNSHSPTIPEVGGSNLGGGKVFFSFKTTPSTSSEQDGDQYSIDRDQYKTSALIDKLV